MGVDASYDVAEPAARPPHTILHYPAPLVDLHRPRRYRARHVRHHPSPADAPSLSRRELLAGAGAGAAALLLDRATPFRRSRAAGRAVVFANTTVVTVDGTQNDVALAVEGGRYRGDRADRSDPQDISAGRGLQRPGQGAVPGPDQLPRAPWRDASPAGSTRTSASPTATAWPCSRASLLSREEDIADGHGGRRARGHQDRHHDGRRERRQHRPTAPTAGQAPGSAGCSPSRPPTARAARRCRRRSSPGARRRASRRRCATTACSASADLLHGLARQAARAASACSPPPVSPRTRRPNCCRRSAPSPRSTTSATRSTCRRAGPKSTTCRSTTA